MSRHKIYIQAAEQISMQEPLSEAWMTAPVASAEPLVYARNPRFGEFVSPLEARRMAMIMKRALATSIKALGSCGIEHPDAIITATSLGSLDCTEKFLAAIARNGEQLLTPTLFMQSTHNTVGSALGIRTKCHDYNITYSHGGISFELALQDAWMQMTLGRISNALVGSHDEIVENYYELMRKCGYVGQPGMVPCGEVAVAMILRNDCEGGLCELCGMEMMQEPTAAEISEKTNRLLRSAGMEYEDIDCVMTGVNGNAANDRHYDEIAAALFTDKPLLRYKHLFGENYTASAFSVYAAAHCLEAGFVPETMSYGNVQIEEGKRVGNMLLCNYADEHCSLILLRKG